MKILVYGIIILLFLAVTFFGVGPILLADGTVEERIWTSVVVLGIYIGLTILLIVCRRFFKRDER
ncbi:DUF6954 family protein [Ornithinibacillus halotolerans]|uniref:Uncharacterized protein n=1 Tax=Ornithinibacillus halotolerans TaxID=1274357 RepID=A0A916RKG3_9BACI|nr:hypothetical protein [Ornithinibacillus halotolerans]GGA59968.1 hypothetical protein GCM10008025_00020 [Ornithinibacillus halotolerans]